MLAKTWLPRVTEVDDIVEVDGCAAGTPAAAVITLETSAAADAIIVEVALDAADVALAAPVVCPGGAVWPDVPVVAAVIWLDVPVVCATGVAPDVAGVGGAVKRMNAENNSMSFWKLAAGLRLTVSAACLRARSGRGR